MSAVARNEHSLDEILMIGQGPSNSVSVYQKWAAFNGCRS